LESVAERFTEMGCDLHAAEAWTQTSKLAKGRRAAAAHRAAVECGRRCEGARTPLLATPTSLAVLSRREREIAHLARSGMRRKEIAEHLVISQRTVDSHLQRIYHKLGVQGRRGLRDVLADDSGTLGESRRTL
jgi:DNA-binding CsgD family transcriptional regulator